MLIHINMVVEGGCRFADKPVGKCNIDSMFQLSTHGVYSQQHLKGDFISWMHLCVCIVQWEQQIS